MRGLVLQMQTSLDGYVGRKGDGPGWQVWDWGPQVTWDTSLIARFNRFFEQADTILLSRRIVEGGYVRHWGEMAQRFKPDSDFAFAHRIGILRKIAFSTSGKTVGAAGVEMASRPLAETVEALKREPGAEARRTRRENE